MVDVHHDLVAALMTLDCERPHAIGAHILQRHRLDRIIEAGAGRRGAEIACQFGRNLTPIMPRLISELEMQAGDDSV
jgi:hypothetical protein